MSMAFTVAASRAAEYNHPAEEWLSQFAKATSLGAMLEGGMYGANKGSAYYTKRHRTSKGKKVR